MPGRSFARPSLWRNRSDLHTVDSSSHAGVDRNLPTFPINEPTHYEGDRKLLVIPRLKRLQLTNILRNVEFDGVRVFLGFLLGQERREISDKIDALIIGLLILWQVE